MTDSYYSAEKLGEYLQWDVMTWQKALGHWDFILAEKDTGSCRALELGARDGGLSLYLAEKGMRVVCSDLDGPTELARELHEKHNLSDAVEHLAFSATDIPFADAFFDVVLFKSVLGGIGAVSGLNGIQKAMGEIHRVLKPGGVLLFAENQQGSLFHQQARRRFVAWGKYWYYPTLATLHELLEPFGASEIRTYGFFSCVKKDFAPFLAVDRLICRSDHSPRHYMAYGHGYKTFSSKPPHLHA